MGTGDREREVKFYLQDPQAFTARVVACGARLERPRVHEINLRFDTPAGDLTRQERVLRLRQDTRSRLTYKGPSQTLEGVRDRQEIEFVVDDFAAARALLEALGFQVSLVYEKYRTTYELGATAVTLDEMPFGAFAEVEGPGGDAIMATAELLGLAWEGRVLSSYTVLFEQARQALGLTFQDLTFENFRDLAVTPAALGVRPADGE